MPHGLFCDLYLSHMRWAHVRALVNSVFILSHLFGAPARVNGILKYEFYLDRCFSNLADVQIVVKDTIRVYNNLRPHASCDYLTPDQAHKCSGVLKKRWKNYKRDKRPKEIQPISEEVKLVLAQLLKKEDPVEVVLQ